MWILSSNPKEIHLKCSTLDSYSHTASLLECKSLVCGKKKKKKKNIKIKKKIKKKRNQNNKPKKNTKKHPHIGSFPPNTHFTGMPEHENGAKKKKKKKLAVQVPKDLMTSGSGLRLTQSRWILRHPARIWKGLEGFLSPSPSLQLLSSCRTWVDTV